jgi:hypothetical protein
MKKLIIAALAIAAATTMYAQGTVSMVSDTVVTYGDSCGALAGTKVGSELTAFLVYEGNAVAHQAFAMSSKGAPTGKLKGDVVDTILPAGTTVSGLQIMAGEGFETGPLGAYTGASAPFSYTTGDAADPTKLPDGKLTYDAFTVEYVPEPTTIALGILGLSSLLVLRRRD